MKVLQLIKVCAVGLMALFVPSVSLAEATWNAVWGTTSGGTWGTASNWVDSYVGGTGPADNVNLAAPFANPSASGSNGQLIDLSAKSSLSLHSITGLPFQVIYRTGDNSGSVTVVDPNPFRGLWLPSALSNPIYNVNPETGDEAVFQRFANGHRAQFKVAEGSTARVRDLLGGGMVANSGAGELVLAAPRSLNTRIVAEGAGPLTIEAKSGSDAIAPAGAPYWHLDADKGLQTIQEGGRTYVTNWFDADGRNARAYVPDGTQLGRPFVSSETVNGSHLVDFGGYINLSGVYQPSGTTAETYGQSAFMYTSTTNSDNRYSLNTKTYEAFAVIRAHKAVTGWVGYFGNCGDYSACTELNASRLFDPSYSKMGSGSFGDWDYRAWIDGEARLGYDLNTSAADSCVKWDPTELHVVNFSFSEVTPPSVSAIGTTRGWTEKETGGFLLGEMLVYTNRLTDAERRQTMDYLVRRWKTGAEAKSYDLDAVIIGKADASVNVNAGDTAKIRTLRLANNVKASGCIVKKGEGTLEIEEVQPRSAVIEVRAGDILLSHDTPEASVDVANVPTDMLCWLDAENSTIDGTDEAVVKWFDRRAEKKETVWAEVYSTKDDAKPSRVADAESGLHVIDYGKNVGEANPCGVVKVNGSKMSGVREMFVVWRRNGTGTAGLLWDGGRAGGVRNSNSIVITPGFSYNSAMGSLWTVDGEPRDTSSTTIGDFTDAGNGKLSVVGMTATEPGGYGYCYLALQGWNSGTDRGGCVFGEIICYGRKLADAERRNVTAYLMNKWQNGAKLSLDADDTVSKIAFAEGVAPAVGTRTDRTVGTIVGTGTLTKTGEGQLTVGSVDTAITNLDVAAGTLKTTVDWMADAIFHLDAAAADSFTFADGDKTQVARWRDVRGNGLYAEAYFHASVTNADGTTAMAYPERLKASGSTNGLLADMPYVDFHSLAVQDKTTKLYSQGSSSMRWYQADGSTFFPKNIREAHIVYMDDAVQAAGTTLSCSQNNNTYALENGFLRHNGNNYFYYTGSTGKLQYSTNWVDGVFFSNNILNKASYPGFRVHSILTTADADANSFYNDRNYANGVGGGRICEVILFESFSDTNRWVAVHKYLQKKWKGKGEGASLPVFNGVNIASGATAELANLSGGAVSLAKLTGAGTFKAEGVSGLGEIGATVAADGTVSCATLTGALTLAETGVVTVSLGNPKPAAGRHRIVAASSVANPEAIADWTLQVTGESRCSFSISADATGVYLNVVKPGMLLIVR